jgi:hypothetical protein
MAREASVEVFSGNDLTLLVTVFDADTGNVLSLAGAMALEWRLGKTAKGTPIVTKTIGSGVTIVDGPAGRANIAIDAADTEALKAFAYYHELRLTNSLGKKATVFYGTFTISDNLVRG